MFGLNFCLTLWQKVAIKVISKKKALEENLGKFLPHWMQAG